MNAALSVHRVVRVTHNVKNVHPDHDDPAGRMYQVYRITIEAADGHQFFITCFSEGDTLTPIEAPPETSK